MNDQSLYIGKKIRERREQLLYTQSDLGELAELSPRTIRSIEKGSGASSLTSFIKILDVLGLEIRIHFKPMSDETRQSV